MAEDSTNNLYLLTQPSGFESSANNLTQMTSGNEEDLDDDDNKSHVNCDSHTHREFFDNTNESPQSKYGLIYEPENKKSYNITTFPSHGYPPSSSLHYNGDKMDEHINRGTIVDVRKVVDYVYDGEALDQGNNRPSKHKLHDIVCDTDADDESSLDASPLSELGSETEPELQFESGLETESETEQFTRTEVIPELIYYGYNSDTNAYACCDVPPCSDPYVPMYYYCCYDCFNYCDVPCLQASCCHYTPFIPTSSNYYSLLCIPTSSDYPYYIPFYLASNSYYPNYASLVLVGSEGPHNAPLFVSPSDGYSIYAPPIPVSAHQSEAFLSTISEPPYREPVPANTYPSNSESMYPSIDSAFLPPLVSTPDHGDCPPLHSFPTSHHLSHSPLSPSVPLCPPPIFEQYRESDQYGGSIGHRFCQRCNADRPVAWSKQLADVCPLCSRYTLRYGETTSESVNRSMMNPACSRHDILSPFHMPLECIACSSFATSNSEVFRANCNVRLWCECNRVEYFDPTSEDVAEMSRESFHPLTYRNHSSRLSSSVYPPTSRRSASAPIYTALPSAVSGRSTTTIDLRFQEHYSDCTNCGDGMGLVLCVGCNALSPVHWCGCYPDVCPICYDLTPLGMQENKPDSNNSDDFVGSECCEQTLYFCGSQSASNCSGNCSSSSDSCDLSSNESGASFYYHRLGSSPSTSDDTTVSFDYETCPASYDNIADSNSMLTTPDPPDRCYHYSCTINQSNISSTFDEDSYAKSNQHDTDGRTIEYRHFGDSHQGNSDKLFWLHVSQLEDDNNVQELFDYSSFENSFLEQITNMSGVKHYNSEDDSTDHQFSSFESHASYPKSYSSLGSVASGSISFYCTYNSTPDPAYLGLSSDESLIQSEVTDSGITNDNVQSNLSANCANLNASIDSLTMVSKVNYSSVSASSEFPVSASTIQCDSSRFCVSFCPQCSTLRKRVFCPLCRSRRFRVVGGDVNRTQSCPALFPFMTFPATSPKPAIATPIGDIHKYNT